MNERTYTEAQALEIARQAVALYAAKPTKACYTVKEAAEFLEVSTRTVARMNLRRNAAGKIPYEELASAAAAK